MRNEGDLSTLACPPKYRDMNTFYKYYSGEKVRFVLSCDASFLGAMAVLHASTAGIAGFLHDDHDLIFLQNNKPRQFHDPLIDAVVHRWHRC